VSDFSVRAVSAIAPPSVESFQRRYVHEREPVILRGLIEDWPARQRWSLAYFREAFGERRVPVAHASGPTGFFHPKRGVSYRPLRVADYLDGLSAAEPNQRYMLFPAHKVLPELLDDVRRPAYRAHSRWFRTRFWFAAADTGGPLHRDLPENLYAQSRGTSGSRSSTIAPRASSTVIHPGPACRTTRRSTQSGLTSIASRASRAHGGSSRSSDQATCFTSRASSGTRHDRST